MAGHIEPPSDARLWTLLIAALAFLGTTLIALVGAVTSFINRKNEQAHATMAGDIEKVETMANKAVEGVGRVEVEMAEIKARLPSREQSTP